MKVKRVFSALLIVAVLFGAVNAGGVTAKAAALDEADLCLMDTIELMIDEDIQSLDYDREELFNLDLEAVGYGYQIEINGKSGFALMINMAGYYEVSELYPSKSYPYGDIDGMPVYAAQLCYIEYIDDQYIDIENELVLDEDQLARLREKGFGYEDDDEYEGYKETPAGGTKVTETINYTSRTVESVRISGAVPGYFCDGSLYPNACAVRSGSVVVGYYSRYFPEFTPGYTVGMVLGTSYWYFPQGQSGVIEGVIGDLYVRMGTNVGGSGTTATGFRNGLASYVQSKGRSITYTSVVSNNVLNDTLYKSKLQSLQPAVLFFNTYNVIRSLPTTTTVNTDKYERSEYSGMHVVIGYGYHKYMYYTSGVNFRTDYYLNIYTGVLDCDQGYIKLYTSSILVEGYAINIY